MGDEAVEGSSLGTKLIFFVAIIGFALVAFLVGKSLISSGIDGLEKTSRKVSDSQFSDYNKRVVKGRSVKSALDTFSGQEYIILVHTLAMGDADSSSNVLAAIKDTRGTSTEENKKLAIANTATGDLTETDALERVVELNASGAADTKKDSNNGVANADPVYINYNALALNNKGQLQVKNGNYLYDDSFALSKKTGNVLYNTNTTYTTKKGATEYISDSSSFDSSLIKNASGEIVGIVFSQKKIAN